MLINHFNKTNAHTITQCMKPECIKTNLNNGECSHSPDTRLSVHPRHTVDVQSHGTIESLKSTEYAGFIPLKWRGKRYLKETRGSGRDMQTPHSRNWTWNLVNAVPVPVHRLGFISCIRYFMTKQKTLKVLAPSQVSENSCKINKWVGIISFSSVRSWSKDSLVRTPLRLL